LSAEKSKKTSLEEQRKKSTWVGRDKTISKGRIEPLVKPSEGATKKTAEKVRKKPGEKLPTPKKTKPTKSQPKPKPKKLDVPKQKAVPKKQVGVKKKVAPTKKAKAEAELTKAQQRRIEAERLLAEQKIRTAAAQERLDKQLSKTAAAQKRLDEVTNPQFSKAHPELGKTTDVDVRSKRIMDKTTVDGLERGMVFDAEGKLLWEGTGAETSIEFPGQIFLDADGLTTVHTHPNNTGPSDGDWNELIGNAFEREHIIETLDERYILRREKGTQSTVLSRGDVDVRKEWDGIVKDIAKSRMEWRSLPAAEQVTWVQNETNKEMAKRWGFKYEVIQK
jgi:hypothetical protein